MIRVNLLKNKGSIVTTSPVDSVDMSLDAGFKTDSGPAPMSEQLEGILKILIMCSGLLCLFGYQKYMDAVSREKVAKVTLERERLRELKVEKQTRASGLPELEKKLEFFKQRLEEFNKATRYRLGELESLDAIQTSITRESWINSVNYNDGSLNIQGSSYSGLGFDKFNENLERQRVFKSVRFNKVSDDSNSNNSIIQFQLTAEINEEYFSGR